VSAAVWSLWGLPYEGGAIVNVAKEKPWLKEPGPRMGSWGNLWGGWVHLVQSGRNLFVLREDDVELPVDGDRNNFVSVKSHIHDRGIARGSDVLGQSFPNQIVL
jgi:hypothetical protein